MKHVTFFVLFLIFICITSCTGQTNANLPEVIIKPEIQRATILHAPGTSVRGIIQDRDGNIWLATNEGIIRYDGKSFTNVTGNVNSDRFFSVFQDKEGNFWFGNYGSGAYYFNGRSLQHFTVNEGLVSNQITSVYEDKTGNIWFGAPGGATRYDGKSFRNYIMKGDTVIEESTEKSFPAFQGGPNPVNPVFQDKKGKFWFGTNNNTFTYDGRQFTVVLNKDGKAITNISAIMEDRAGNLWLGGKGLWRYEGGKFTNFTMNSVRYVCEDKKGNIWTSGSGANGNWALSRFDGKIPGNKPTIIEITQSKNLFGVLGANDGSIWFGSFDGVFRYDGKTITDFK